MRAARRHTHSKYMRLLLSRETSDSIPRRMLVAAWFVDALVAHGTEVESLLPRPPLWTYEDCDECIEGSGSGKLNILYLTCLEGIGRLICSYFTCLEGVWRAECLTDLTPRVGPLKIYLTLLLRARV